MRQLKTAAMAAWTAAMALLWAAPAEALQDAAACGVETARQETAQRIPDRLLHAISLVESGRYDTDSRAVFAWPWTVNAEGEGRFLPSKEAAIAEVRKLQARGVRNIDVGCMQVNLLAHPNAFASLDEAFEPATNVGYAARFLMGLYDSTQDWPTAAAYYHSQTPSLAAGYKSKLMTTWENARRRDDPRLQFAAVQNQAPVGVFFRPPRFQDGQKASASRAAAEFQAQAKARVEAERAEAKRIADAYRQARLEEYRLRKAQPAKSQS